ncbi:L-ribulose-5-phosphate 3-epimerase [Arthrobacter methylotrophus]|uniref:L-ribulose-5-phosphate 3-epimerase n=1 Tax=Arthrobacter methylotrophus TaxID=121291 RepID=A0ABV5USV1_9MICC
MAHPIGIHEKALPGGLSWKSTFELVRESGYDYYELSIDASDQCIARLQWSAAERRRVLQAASSRSVQIMTVALSAHRRFPWGSSDPETRSRADWLAKDAIELAYDLEASCVQIAGYFTRSEPAHKNARNYFLDGLARSLPLAEKRGVVLALENVDDSDITTVDEGLEVLGAVESESLKLYVDVGNLAGSEHDVTAQLKSALPVAFGVQLKDARPGEFRRVPYGEGTVPFSDVFREISKQSPDMPLSIEMWNDAGDSSMASDAYQWLLSQWSKSVHAELEQPERREPRFEAAQFIAGREGPAFARRDHLPVRRRNQGPQSP